MSGCGASAFTLALYLLATLPLVLWSRSDALRRMRVRDERDPK